MFEKSFLVDFGHYFYMYERFEENKQKKLTLESSIKMMLDAISFITQSEDPLAREVTDLFCCISACAHYINTEHSVLASNNNGIDWHKLTCLKRELMFEPTLNRHRSRPIEQKDERFWR